jgi:hypothetical protein
MQNSFREYWLSELKGLRESDKILLIKKKLNSIIKYDEPANMFMLEERKMTGLLSIVKSMGWNWICSRRFIYTAFVSYSERQIGQRNPNQPERSD